MKFFVALVSVAVLLGGCASGPAQKMFYQPTTEELAVADYGTYPANYQDIIKNFMQGRLKDPESARYRFKEPRKGYTAARKRDDVIYVYRVDAYINAKNSYGGYIGEHNYVFDIRNGKIVWYADFTETLQEYGL